MQMASSGARALSRSTAKYFRPPSGTRAIHLNPLPRANAPQLVNSAWSRKLVSTTRTVLRQFFTHLTAPGLPTPSTSCARAFHGVGARANTIQQRLSLPARTIISRPIQTQYFPRAPIFQTRSVANVGLGSARNFSTGRAVFQNLANNVPVAGRAFCEVDWDMKFRPPSQLRNSRRERKAPTIGRQQMKAIRNNTVASDPIKEAPAAQEELDYYFRATPVPSVTTYLLIPLPPTPTTRTPLAPDGHTSTSLLPLSDLITLHSDHEKHRLRVSSLFSRLDAADVWRRSVTCSAYAQSASIEGVCTILRVEFVGWTKAEVRSVIGESGTGWCVLEETCAEDQDDMSDASSILSGMSSPYLGSSSGPISGFIDESLVLPSLDLSAAHRDASEAAGSWARDNVSLESLAEAWTDLSFDEGHSAWDDDSVSTDSNFRTRLGFSSSFSQHSLQA